MIHYHNAPNILPLLNLLAKRRPRQKATGTCIATLYPEHVGDVVRGRGAGYYRYIIEWNALALAIVSTL
jgi:hypothetical protein